MLESLVQMLERIATVLTSRTINGLQSFFLILDINECSAVSHNCHGVANCHNTIGSFTCSCRSDYTGDGLVCEPIGEEL